MFENTGEKLQKLAFILLILGVVGSVVLAFTFGFDRSPYGDSAFLAVPFFTWLIGGPLVSYLQYLLLYGFGVLIVDAAATRSAVEKLNKAVSALGSEANREKGAGRPGAAGQEKAAPVQTPPVRESAVGKMNKAASAQVAEAKQEQSADRADASGEADGPVVPVPAGNGKVTCPVCGAVQRENRLLCMNCGTRFIRGDET